MKQYQDEDIEHEVDASFGRYRTSFMGDARSVQIHFFTKRHRILSYVSKHPGVPVAEALQQLDVAQRLLRRRRSRKSKPLVFLPGVMFDPLGMGTSDAQSA